MTVMQWKTGN